MNKVFISLGILCVVFLSSNHSLAQFKIDENVDEMISEFMDKGDIPGISLIVSDTDSTYIRNYGYSDLETKKEVTANTLFQLGDCSMAFTALEILELAEAKEINLDSAVSKYLPNFHMKLKGQAKKISIRQLLHHTSGIPKNANYKILGDDGKNDLKNGILRIREIPLSHEPGEKFIYSHANYSILACLIQKIKQEPFEDVIFELVHKKLRLRNTTIGFPEGRKQKASGYKNSFYYPRYFENQNFEWENASRNIFSNATDISKWLEYQTGKRKDTLFNSILTTHRWDETTMVRDAQSYGMGWIVSMSGDGQIFKSGSAPNYSSFISFNKKSGKAIAVLANSNSVYTTIIGEELMQLMSGGSTALSIVKKTNRDKIYSFFSILALLYNVCVTVLLIWILYQAVKGKRSYNTNKKRTIKNIAVFLLVVLPFFVGMTFIPSYLGYVKWEHLLKWEPASFNTLIFSMILAFSLSFLVYSIGLVFPSKNKHLGKVPQIILMSIISGLSNVVVISMVTTSFQSEVPAVVKMFYYLLVVYTFLIGRRVVQYNLIRISFGLVYDLKIDLISKVFSTPYKNFEQMNTGRIYTVINEDVNTIGRASGTIASLVISAIAILGCFVYLAIISVKITMVLLATLLVISIVYHFVVQNTEHLYEKSRDEGSKFMTLLDGMLNGFKELSLHLRGKLSYKADIDKSALSYRNKVVEADTRFLNADLLGASMILVLLGVLAIGLPILNPGVNFYVLASFVIILLYAMAPIETFLNAAPELMRIKVAWNRINNFVKDLPKEKSLELENISDPKAFDSIEIKNVSFCYAEDQDTDRDNPFGIGPINLQIEKEEIIFIIGANGSGKSTLAKILLGLYQPVEGDIMIDGDKVSSNDLSEYFSAVFNPTYIFKKLHNVKQEDYKKEDVDVLLSMLKLNEKVELVNNYFSTVDLSSGQRKRLALLQCYLEDNPIFLFDEWAADQDPYYRNFFYNVLLPKMKKAGKTVIAITHDDSYFHIADRVYEMRDGKLNLYDISLSAKNLFQEI